MIKFYCEWCHDQQPVEIERAIIDDTRTEPPGLFSNGIPWGDIICKRCGFVVATFFTEHEGQLQFTADLIPREMSNDN